MIIEIHIFNDHGDVVSEISADGYDEIVKRVSDARLLIRHLESGGTGVIICKGCGGEYLWGEDKRVDAGLVCENCAKGIIA